MRARRAHLLHFNARHLCTLTCIRSHAHTGRRSRAHLFRRDILRNPGLPELREATPYHVRLGMLALRLYAYPSL